MTVLGGDADAVYTDLTPVRVAMARARETAAECPLFTDPYAGLLAGGAGEDRPAITNYVSARTKWFDDYFLAASSAGVSQVVILAGALDTRAWRLPWLNDTVIYEVEQSGMLEFKQRALAQAGAKPAARHVPVPVDPDGDWPRALTAAGFDHNEPTAWAAEGLLPTLSPEAQEQLLDSIDLYSAQGSRIGVETLSSGPDHACSLCARLWEVNSTTISDLMYRYHRGAPDGPSGLFLDGRKL
ncbi:class I SAM-dependent methyltransferase [Mycolicibacterium austroafricanum]|uniref:class I SAM-dependent methyltransferase n=1 Tax=Mycolicibacterium austroafricanum TaxID=39687 RepID=UPI001CA30509|nr:class I SAM-dependent methyltransferase [Mycolicibacterium austroafricanum]QZT60570.1 class I SAM-dependent methyltransferase [Mycolicibacterium austroafricanum]